jgi:hypothetical protein
VDSSVPVRTGVSFEVTLVVHPVVEHTDDKDARLVGFEEHAVAATGSHRQVRSEVVAVAADDSASEESFHGRTHGAVITG